MQCLICNWPLKKCQLLQQLHNCFFAVCACHRATGLKNSSNMKRFFVSALSQVNSFMNLTFESIPNRHSIKILIKSTMWLGVTTLFPKCFLAGWYSSWRGSSVLRVRFYLAFSLDSFSRSHHVASLQAFTSTWSCRASVSLVVCRVHLCLVAFLDL